MIILRRRPTSKPDENQPPLTSLSSKMSAYKSGGREPQPRRCDGVKAVILDRRATSEPAGAERRISGCDTASEEHIGSDETWSATFLRKAFTQ
jgi:hypothetical protein